MIATSLASIQELDVDQIRPGNFQLTGIGMNKGMDEQHFPPLTINVLGRSKIEVENVGIKTWAKVAGEGINSHGGMNLTYYPPGNESLMRIERTDVAAGVEKWRHAVIGYVLGYNPTYTTIKSFVEKRWKEFGEIKVISLKNGTYVFNFQTEHDKVKVLEQSPWPIGSKMVFLKPWSPEIDLRKEDLDSVPVWIRLPNLKLHYYTGEGLSKMASCIGTPLYIDKQTASQERVSYARVCVELNAKSFRTNQIKYVNEYGQMDYQEMEYE